MNQMLLADGQTQLFMTVTQMTERQMDDITLKVISETDTDTDASPQFKL